MRIRGLEITAVFGYVLLAAVARADTPAPAPDDSFLEFLGQDDVEDAKWWEFFSHPAQHAREDSGDSAPQEEEKR